MSYLNEQQCIPDGYNLVEYEYPHPSEQDVLDVEEHPLFEVFLDSCRATGFDTASGGFRGSGEAYFRMWLRGWKACERAIEVLDRTAQEIAALETDGKE